MSALYLSKNCVHGPGRDCADRRRAQPTCRWTSCIRAHWHRLCVDRVRYRGSTCMAAILTARPGARVWAGTRLPYANISADRCAKESLYGFRRVCHRGLEFSWPEYARLGIDLVFVIRYRVPFRRMSPLERCHKALLRTVRHPARSDQLDGAGGFRPNAVSYTVTSAALKQQAMITSKFDSFSSIVCVAIDAASMDGYP